MGQQQRPVGARDFGEPVLPGLAGAVVRTLDEEGVSVDDVEVHPPWLDEVFFALTGHPAGEFPADPGTVTGTGPESGAGRRPGAQAQTARAVSAPALTAAAASPIQGDRRLRRPYSGSRTRTGEDPSRV